MNSARHKDSTVIARVQIQWHEWADPGLPPARIGRRGQASGNPDLGPNHRAKPATLGRFQRHNPPHPASKNIHGSLQH